MDVRAPFRPWARQISRPNPVNSVLVDLKSVARAYKSRRRKFSYSLDFSITKE